MELRVQFRDTMENMQCGKHYDITSESEDDRLYLGILRFAHARRD